MIVDLHAHAFPPDVIERRAEYIARDEAFAAVYGDGTVPLATADDLVVSMKEAGVDRSVVCGFSWKDAGLCREHSAYLLEVASKSEGRLVPFCTVHPADDGARKDMERFAARGARGLGEVRPRLQGYGLIDSEEADLLAWGAAAYDLAVMFHPAEPVGPASPGRAGAPIDHLARFIADFPGVTVIAAHLGGGLPFYALMPEVKDTLETTWFDTAGSDRAYRSDGVQRVIDLVGDRRVAFGSDFPRAGQRDALEQLRAAGLDAETEERVLGRNATQLLRIS